MSKNSIIAILVALVALMALVIILKERGFVHNCGSI